jgi:hypothetical protein
VYSAIEGDDEAKTKSPVIKACGWFELPMGFKVMVKEFVEGPYFDFNHITPEQMLEHREILNRLGIYDMDIMPKKFVAGQLADLSDVYVIPILQDPPFDTTRQCFDVKVAILNFMGLLHKRTLSPEILSKLWEDFLKNFDTDRLATQLRRSV